MGKSRQRELNKIMVVGLPTTSTSDDLLKLCRPFGNPLEASVAVDAEGKPRGFGFVRFGDDEAPEAAIKQLDKSVFQGRTLNVRHVEERDAPSIPRAAGSGAKARPCFDFARGKCAKGANCKWAHIKPPGGVGGEDEDGASSRRPDWQKKRPAAASAAPSDLLQDIPDDYCRKFQFGKCHRGASCHWRHELWRGGRSAKEADAPAAEGGTQARSLEQQPASSAISTSNKRSRASFAHSDGPAAVRVKREEEDLAVRMVDLRKRIARREAEWRSSADVGSSEAIPAAAKNKDVVWHAMERTLAKLVHSS